MSSIHTLTALGLAALDLVSGADISVMGVMGLNTPEFHTRMSIILGSWGQVRNAVISMGDPEVLGRRGVCRMKMRIHI
jgi:hypothetical protein